MTEAINQPVTRRGRPAKELSTTDLEVGQRPKIILPDEGPIVREAEEIVPVETSIDQDYLKELAFNEEPVQIIIHPIPGKNPPKQVPLGVQGRDEWVPVNFPWILARKYVEVLARSKADMVNTIHDDANVEKPQNMIERTTSLKTPFSVLRDDNPKGGMWLAKILAEG